MPTFTFTGDYETNAELPDGTMKLVEPGQPYDLPFESLPGAWTLTPPVSTKPAKTPVEVAPEPTPEVTLPTA